MMKTEKNFYQFEDENTNAVVCPKQAKRNNLGRKRGVLTEVSTNKAELLPIEKNEIVNVEEEERFLPPNLTSNLFNIDKNDSHDYTNYSEYVNEVYQYIFSLEKSFVLSADFMSFQKDVNVRMRSIVVDWIVQVQNRFRMLPETLQLTVRIMDSYLAKKPISRKDLQLVGVASMLIAAKYEEMLFPEIGDFVYVTNSAFSAADIIAMELDILIKIDFFVGFPLPLHFLRRFSKAIGANSRTHKMAKYFVELSLMNEELASLDPSLLAAASLSLAARLLKECKWNDEVVYHSTYTAEQLLPIAAKIAKFVKTNEGSNLKSIFKKYADKHNDCISTHKVFASNQFLQLTKERI